MATLGQFASNMRAQAKRVPLNVLDLKRTVAANVVKGVVQATPIDTGQARFNWNVAFNKPDYSTDMVGFSKYGRLGDWMGKMATSMLAISRAGPQDSIYISNALPYIQELNRGKSSQASPDYVRTAALIAARSVAERPILR